MFAIPSFFYLVSTIPSAVYTIHSPALYIEKLAYLIYEVVFAFLCFKISRHIGKAFLSNKYWSKLYLVKSKERKDANATSYWIFIPILLHTQIPIYIERFSSDFSAQNLHIIQGKSSCWKLSQIFQIYRHFKIYLATVSKYQRRH